MSTAGAQLQFGAEFAVFLVALAGLSFVLLRAELLVDGSLQRFSLATGLGCIGAAAFLHGSLVVDDPNSASLVGLRVAGALGLGAAFLGAGRHSIPTRVAASSAALLLAVVLAVALALSVVISNNVERDAVRRFRAEAAAEAD